ncbi:hypothetical protein HN51_070334 [Arachis hypogaea]|uniref:cytochrome P450 82A3 n=1 Tax=Arachis ipaensis TaxID=130454 RepID=UPI0007AFBA3C|nr:cytochrome P450 82A3 [Arachis ipaensis]XP_020980032.1 cytochrome P450 82A3 [Arachis ipaensis]XP_025655321.1 cytochrome P450 82A3 [Arachis hypogaea]
MFRVFSHTRKVISSNSKHKPTSSEKNRGKMDSVLNYINPTAIIGILSLIVLLYILLFRPFKRGGNLKEPPMAAGAWPILGHLPLLRGSQPLHLTLGTMADKYGPLFTIKFGATKTIVLSNWEMAKECFTINDMAVSSRPKTVAIENLSYNFAVFGLGPYGPYWRELRKIATLELLSNRQIELLGHVRVSEVQASINELYSLWSRKKNKESYNSDDDGYVSVEMKEWFSQLTFNTVLRMIAGKRYFGGATTDAVSAAGGEEKAKKCLKLIEDFMHLLGLFTVGDAIPALRWMDLGGHERAMKRTAKELDSVLNEWLEEHRRSFGEKATSERDFMDVMISIIGKKKIHGFDADTIIKATTMAMIVGGTDTTGVTLTWALSLLLRNPRTLKKVKEELDSQIGKERCITESDLNKLVYLQAIVKETLRLYPAGPLGGPREFTESCTLGGFYVKKGSRLITNIWKIQTDPSIWSDPLEFKPERFLTTHRDTDLKGQHFELLPFGSGRRMCPGMSFALQMVHFALARFLHSFEILKPSSDEAIDMTGILGLSYAKATPIEILIKPCLAQACYETT